MRRAALPDRTITVTALLALGLMLAVAFWRDNLRFTFVDTISFTLALAFAEELVFRRWLLELLISRVDSLTAALTSSGLFALVHIPAYGISPPLLGIFLGGLVLVVTYLSSGSLILSTLVHTLMNITTKANMSVAADQNCLYAVLGLTCVETSGLVVGILSLMSFFTIGRFFCLARRRRYQSPSDQRI